MRRIEDSYLPAIDIADTLGVCLSEIMKYCERREQFSGRLHIYWYSVCWI